MTGSDRKWPSRSVTGKSVRRVDVTRNAQIGSVTGECVRGMSVKESV